MFGWGKKGCETCRRAIYGASAEPIAVSIERHGQLYRCHSCGSFWEIGERAAYLISEQEARKDYPDAF